MTIRQVLLASGGVGSPAPMSSISFKGRDSAEDTTITIPSHASGDLIVIAARGTDSVPSGWTKIKSGSYQFGASKIVAGYKVAAGGSEVSGTWTGANELHVGVYDGAASVGASAVQTSGNTVSWPALTLTATDGSSWVTAFGYDASTAPSGMTKRATGTRITLNDTAAGTSSWTATTTFSSASSTAVIIFELVAE